MEFIQMKCPNCAADLDVENGLDSFYCKYCGTKIMIAGQSKHVLKAKTRMHVIDKLGDIQKEYHKRKEEEARQSSEQAKKALPWFIGFFIVMMALLCFSAFMMDSGRQKEERRLEAIYAEVQTDIAEGNYTDALVKANGLYYTEGGSESRKKWDNIREGTIAIINDLK